MAIKNYRYGVIHAIVKCLDCDWETQSYKNAQAIARIHAEAHKHRVEGELGIAIMYDGRE